MKQNDEVGLIVSDMGTGRKSYLLATLLGIYGPEDNQMADIDLGGERLQVMKTQILPWAEVPDEMKETYLVAGPQRPKLGDTLPMTVEDWQALYAKTRRQYDRYRETLEAIQQQDAGGFVDRPLVEVVDALQQIVRNIKALAAEALEGK